MFCQSYIKKILDLYQYFMHKIFTHKVNYVWLVDVWWLNYSCLCVYIYVYELRSAVLFIIANRPCPSKCTWHCLNLFVVVLASFHSLSVRVFFYVLLHYLVFQCFETFVQFLVRFASLSCYIKRNFLLVHIAFMHIKMKLFSQLLPVSS